MPPRTENFSQTLAEDTVFGNLGLSRDELGLPDDGGSGNEDLDQGGSGNDDLGGSGNDDLGGSGNDDFSLEDLGLDSQPQRTQRQQQPRVTHTEPRLPANAEVKPDKKGNLVNAAGQIVARAGKEARMYQDLHKARGQVQNVERQRADVQTRLEKAVEIGRGLHTQLTSLQGHQKAVADFGLDQTEHLTALRLFKELRDNPAAAIKNILTRAATNGINVAELGLQPGGIDPKSLTDVIRQQIDAAMNPLKAHTAETERQRKEAQQLETRKAEINAEVSSFFTENPEARKYIPVFTNTKQTFPDMSLGEIWARIQLQLKTNPPDERRQNSRGPNGSRRSLPNGRPAPMVGTAEDLAPISESYESIVKKAMTDAGLV